MISLALWNTQLNITDSKIYYSVLGIPTTLVVKQNEIAYSIINSNFDSPYTFIARIFKNLDHPEAKQKFDQRHGTVEFIFLKANLVNWFRHRFSLIQLSAFSQKQTALIIKALEQHWRLETDI